MFHIVVLLSVGRTVEISRFFGGDSFFVLAAGIFYERMVVSSLHGAKRKAGNTPFEIAEETDRPKGIHQHPQVDDDGYKHAAPRVPTLAGNISYV